VEMLERVLQYSNHIGLFSEDIDFTSKRLLGNFPQGYSHIALIDTALTISNSQQWLKEKSTSSRRSGFHFSSGQNSRTCRIQSCI